MYRTNAKYYEEEDIITYHDHISPNCDANYDQNSDGNSTSNRVAEEDETILNRRKHYQSLFQFKRVQDNVSCS